MTKISKQDLILRDWLAVERTYLANERTFLAYFRTAFVFLATGLTIVKVDSFSSVTWLGELLLVCFPLVLGFGIYRLLKTNRQINAYYEEETED